MKKILAYILLIFGLAMNLELLIGIISVIVFYEVVIKDDLKNDEEIRELE